ncbi:hypothetical protein CUMW_272150 [Citrus unshiu]|uniref:NB-ARC domain-containing protein n=1 Tax=Citrus unshiu TaxID=55188 RepID=A0A2H5QXZ4_CITUN|nr:hypothetical protein CUMW_272150 [Citrus unshiu]
MAAEVGLAAFSSIVSEELEFDKVGIPSRDVEKERMDDQRRCTIILTSRRQDLLRNVMNSQKEIQIDALLKEEALQRGAHV